MKGHTIMYVGGWVMAILATLAATSREQAAQGYAAAAFLVAAAIYMRGGK